MGRNKQTLEFYGGGGDFDRNVWLLFCAAGLLP